MKARFSLTAVRGQILSDAGWVLGLRIVRQAVSILVVAVLVRLVSGEEFGRYQLVVTLMGLFAVTALPGIPRAIIQSVARGFDGTFRAGTRLSFRFSLIGAILMVLLAGGFWLRGDAGQAAAIAVAALLFPAAQGLNQWQSLQIGRRRFRENTIRISVGTIGSSVAVMAMAAAGFTAPAALVAATFGVLALQNIIQQRRALRSVPHDAPPEPGSIAYGRKSSVWDMFNIAANHADRLLVFALGSPVELAAYAVADRIPEVIKANVQQFMAVMAPRFAIRDAYTHALDRKLTLAGAAAAACVLVFAFAVIPFVFPLLYTQDYASSVIFCQLILVSIAIGCFAMVKNAFIGARMDLKGQRDILMFSALVRLISSAALIWWLGVLGAAISTIVYRLSTVALVEWHIRRHYLGRPLIDNG